MVLVILVAIDGDQEDKNITVSEAETKIGGCESKAVTLKCHPNNR